MLGHGITVDKTKGPKSKTWGQIQERGALYRNYKARLGTEWARA
jgi:hypothetical protein